MKLVLSILTVFLMLPSCSSEVKTVKVEVPKTEYVYVVPNKTPVPSAPSFEKFNTKEAINSVNNFKKLQRNMIKFKNYTVQLKEVIKFYENEIDEIQKAKDDAK